MSRDIFVQDLPPGINAVSEIPPDFEPSLIGSRANIITAIRSIAPDADFSNPSWGKIVRPHELIIEVNLGDSEDLYGFALHIAGGDQAELLISAILNSLGLRAIDPSSATGLFKPFHS